jgi:hypothetical protein
MSKHWSSGDVIVLRYISRRAGVIGAAEPHIVVRDEPDLIACFMPDGTRYRAFPEVARDGRPEWIRTMRPGQRQELVDRTWRGHVLKLMLPGRPYSVWLSWRPGTWAFAWWYVNLEAPLERTPIGIDTADHTLDIVIRPDRSWYWKDDDELEARVERGMVSREHAEAVRAEGKRVVDLIEGWESPFRDGWERWRPDPAWKPPALPVAWEDVPSPLLAAGGSPPPRG